jgi:hypothetical protein
LLALGLAGVSLLLHWTSYIPKSRAEIREKPSVEMADGVASPVRNASDPSGKDEVANAEFEKLVKRVEHLEQRDDTEGALKSLGGLNVLTVPIGEKSRDRKVESANAEGEKVIVWFSRVALPALGRQCTVQVVEIDSVDSASGIPRWRVLRGWTQEGNDLWLPTSIETGEIELKTEDGQVERSPFRTEAPLESAASVRVWLRGR